ncbi:ATP-binding Cassette (ABC) Superfamily [Phytophthora cinnamomi]|uniref:ATP-binding Cassette (ABC) Superfamily n=1 Tax=Phytophthora cinnamomi TaxID=4785 RepID=UPI00355A915B|nr:ATP-binding Cassette (ABC) Superfamily [Phytophthora cinnamomi]
MGVARDQQHYVSAPSTPLGVQDDNAGKFANDPTAKADTELLSQQPNPLATASILAVMMVTWLQPMVVLGAKRVLEKKDIWPICDVDSCASLGERFRREYGPHDKMPFGLSPVAVAFVRTFKREIIVTLVNCLVYIFALSMQSYVVQAVLQFLSGEENLFHVDSGYWLLAIMAVASILAVASLNYAFFVSSRTGANMRSLVMDLVYQKSLRLSCVARQEYSTGEVLTLMSVDTERVFTVMMESPWIVVGPVSFIISVVLVGFLFDVPSAAGGAVTLIIVSLVSVLLGNSIARIQHDLLTVIDERVKVTSESLQGIRVMKFYAWEESLAHRVEKIRAKEIALLRKFHLYQVVNTVMLFLTPAFLSGVTLGIYVAINGTISVVEAFTLIAMVNICRTALIQLPVAIAALSHARIAFARIDLYLQSDEYGQVLLEDGTNHDHGTAASSSTAPVGNISVREADFEWPVLSSTADIVVVTPALTGDEASTHTLREISDRMFELDRSASTSFSLSTPSVSAGFGVNTNSDHEREQKSFRLEGVNLEIDPGSLVMIIGTVGAGKSSLINALLGEMTLKRGSFDVHGDVAYVSQDTWIRNLNVRDNILFGEPFHAKRYHSVLKASQLAMDLHALPHGDQTEIGERGINLSGGQKARVAIARAMYRPHYEILLLDDPLSAVDPHVAHGIFDECVMGLARSKTRILVLNSHYDLLTQADKVLVLRDGAIAGDGTYDDITAMFPELGVAPGEAARSSTIAGHSSRKDEKNDMILEDFLPDTDKPPVQAVPAVVDKSSNGAKIEDGGDTGGQLIQAEDRVKGTVTMSVYKTYFDESGLNGLVVIFLIVVFYTVSQAVRVVVDWWPSHWAKNMSRRGIDPTYSGEAFALWYVGLIVLATLLTLGRALFLTESCVKTSKNLHNELFRRVLAAPVNRYFDVTPVGRVLNRFSNDLDQLDSSLPKDYQLLVQHASMALGSLVVSAFASYWIAVAYIPIIAIFFITGQFFKKTSCEVKRLEGVTRTPVYNLFSETLSGLQTIRAFKMQNTFERMNKKVVDENANMYITFWAAGRWLAARLDMLSVVIIVVVTAYLVSTKGQLNAMTAGISLTYSLMLTSVVQWVMRSVDRVDSAMTSVERLLYFRQIPQEVDASDCTPINSTVWPSQGAIKFDKLCLKYRPELPLVLRGVSMDIRGGEKVGICGRTGAGKSSLMIALFRICEFDSGNVAIDGLNISSLRLQDLRRSLAIIPQDPVLFSGPIRENLDPFGEYSDAEIWTVLQQVHMADSLEKWGAGLDFEVSECGDNLSVGQRQLVCIGRALLKNSKIVVLDEATANVDTATDSLIQATIRETFADKTVLIIAHRIHTIMHCNKIAVMDVGQVAEFGSPAELLAQPESIFASLAKRSELR